jgi:two-component system, OmpR family, KDP operon response regulator KdpE
LSAGRILVVDDERQVRRLMRATLAGAGYEIDDAKTGEEALQKIPEFHPDLVLLDMNMPGMGGLAACHEIRAGSAIAIIMLTVRNTEADKVAALDAGADDFVTKPFSTPELLARIRAALRRTPLAPAAPMRVLVGALRIDFAGMVVRNGPTMAHLTPKELELLRFFVQRPNEAISHRELLQTIWGPQCGDQIDYLRTLIRSLRKKVELDPDNPQYIVTEPWIGYRLNGIPETTEPRQPS